MMIHATGKVATTVVEGLKAGGPLALPLVAVNLLALGLIGYTLWVIADRTSARDQLITELAKNCVIAPKAEGK